VAALRISSGRGHPLQRQIADALRLEIAPPGKVSRDGVVVHRSRQLLRHCTWRCVRVSSFISFIR
jgi:hypothetical protein